MRVPGLRDGRYRTVSGFTLLELLAVIVIILIISAVALPTIVPAISHRQVNEAARILQGALVGARDSAIHNNAPSGIRLLPDPAFPIQYLSNGTIDPSQILAANRIIPIEPAPTYSEGLLSVGATVVPYGFKLPYPGDGGGYYPYYSLPDPPLPGTGVLMIEESAYDPATSLPYPPTSWFWNIRIGDKLQINRAGPWYTIVGPMTQTQANGNSEMFVNAGVPGTPSPLKRLFISSDGKIEIVYMPEFLFLVNGQDDNRNGWTDEGWDGIDNNGDGQVDELAEWEAELWPNQIVALGVQNQAYTIARRPAPATNAREVSLPTQVVVDLTTWNTTQERSRIPAQVLNRYTGFVDFMVYPNGTIAPVSIYSNPASFGLSGAFLHFWLGERSDLAAPSTSVTSAPYLPIPTGLAPTRFNGLELKGDYRLVTVFTRTGQISTGENMPFDDPANPANGTSYNPGLPFTAAQQGSR